MRNQATRGSGLLANPIVIGALTVLVALIAVTLAYQANNGLPFVPRYTLYLQLSNGGEVTRNVEVHMGGALVGTVTKVDPARDAAGQPIALLTLKLNKDVEPLPADSKFNVRLKGAIGLEYLDLTRGTSRRPIATERRCRSASRVRRWTSTRCCRCRCPHANRRPAVDDRLQRRAGLARRRHQRRDRGV